MEIKSDTRVVTGKHKGREFTYRAGFLELFGKSWSRIEIKRLVEIANLLELQGFPLNLKPVKERKNYMYTSIFGSPYLGFDEYPDSKQEDDSDGPKGD